MKNVLIISGSPRRRSNTFKITKLVEEQMTELREMNFEYLALKDLNLAHCRGCMVCMKKGEDSCPCKDDSIMLRDKMLAADGMIFISPVYVHTVSALMKNFYDRFAYMCHQPRFREKAAMFIVTTELTGGEETLQYMRFVAFTWGFKLSTSLEVVYSGFVNNGKYRDQTMDRITQAARDFHSDLISPDRSPMLRELMFFNLMKSKVTLHRDLLPADYLYWKRQGWLDAKFYSDKGIPRLRSAVAKILVKRKVRKLLKSRGLEVVSGIRS